MDVFIKSSWLLYMLLYPFLMSVYLSGLINNFDKASFSMIMRRAHLIALGVFGACGLAGEKLFLTVFNVRFSSFLIFGGIVFLLIGIKSVFQGTTALIETRGEPAHISGAAAMPFMIGPGTVSASIMAGEHQNWIMTLLAITAALTLSFLSILLFKYLLDAVRRHNESLLQRYMEITGKIIALFTGTYAIEMIVKGSEALLHAPA